MKRLSVPLSFLLFSSCFLTAASSSAQSDGRFDLPTIPYAKDDFAHRLQDICSKLDSLETNPPKGAVSLTEYEKKCSSLTFDLKTLTATDSEQSKCLDLVIKAPGGKNIDTDLKKACALLRGKIPNDGLVLDDKAWAALRKARTPDKSLTDMLVSIDAFNAARARQKNLKALAEQFRDPALLKTTRDLALSKKVEEILLNATNTEGNEGKKDEKAPGSGGLESLGQNLAVGLANFVYDRAKHEALVYMREQLNEQLCGEEQASREYLPNTCDALEGFGLTMPLHAIYKALREAARKDVEEMPFSAILKLEEKLRETEAERAKTLVVARLALSFILEASGGADPLELFAGLHQSARLGNLCTDLDPCPYADLQTYLTSASQIQWVLMSQADKEGNRPNLAEEIRKPIFPFRLVAIALHWEEVSGKKLKLEKLETDKLNKLINGAVSWIQRTHVLIEQAKEIADLYKQARKVEKAEEKEALRQMARKAHRQLLINTVNLIPALIEPLLDTRPKWFELLTASTELADSVLRTAYAEVVVDTRNLVGKVCGESTSKGCEKAKKLIGHMSLAVQWASIESSQDAEALFSALALPPGSYKSKYQRPTIHLNAMAGIAPNWELFQTPDFVVGKDRLDFVMGLHIPVGFHVTYPFYKNKYHVGAMVGLLDLGALASLKVDDDFTTKTTNSEGNKEDTQEIPVDLTSLLSPSLILTFGIYESPFLVGFGASFVPEARSFTNPETEKEVSVEALRFGFYLSVDVPLFPF